MPQETLRQRGTNNGVVYYLKGGYLLVLRVIPEKSGSMNYPGAGILSREHPECHRAHHASWHEMVQLAAQAAASRTVEEKSLRLALAESGADQKAVSQLEKASTDRLTLDARPAALAVEAQEVSDRLNVKMG